MTFGLLPTGFNPKTQEDVENAINANIAVAPTLGENLNTDAESSLGQLVIIPAGAIGEVWQATEQLQRSLTAAAGVALDNLVQLFGMARHPATNSTFEQSPVGGGTPNPLTLSGTPGTIIPDGSTIALDDSGARFDVAGPVTIGGGGTVLADATAQDTGPIQALADAAGANWSIIDTVSGWAGVSNTLDGTVGQIAETDGKLRNRARQVVTSAGGTAAHQIKAAVLRLLNVTECIVIENDNPIADSEGRAAHSFEVVVRGGVDQTILDELIQYKPAGIQLVTSVGASFQVPGVVVDANGDNKNLVFSRPEGVNVYLEIDYTAKPNPPTTLEAQIEQAVLDYDATLTTGLGVYPADVRAAILCAFEVNPFSALDIRMGLTASPGGAFIVPTSKTQLADFDSSRILITEI